LKAVAKFASKRKVNKAEEVGEQEDGNCDSKTLNLMVKRFSKFLKYKSKSNAKSA